jgi:hypothetical protein
MMKLKTCVILLLALTLVSAITFPTQECLAGKKMVTYVDSLNEWWPATAIAKQIGVPGYANANDYNVFILAFWTTRYTADMAQLYSTVENYFGTDSVFGTTRSQIQQNVKAAFNKEGKKLLVAAFGSTDMPTTQGADPIKVATDIAAFVKANYLHGVDLDW